jgi:hypothetical protein
MKRDVKEEDIERIATISSLDPEVAKLIAETQGEYSVSVPMKRGTLPLKWTDVYVDGAELKLSPTSWLPTEPAAKRQALSDMWQSQQIERLTFVRLLDDPDLQAELDLETADKLVSDEMLERMRDAEEDEGEAAYMPPSEYQQIWTEDEATGPFLSRSWVVEIEPPFRSGNGFRVRLGSRAFHLGVCRPNPEAGPMGLLGGTVVDTTPEDIGKWTLDDVEAEETADA